MGGSISFDLLPEDLRDGSVFRLYRRQNWLLRWFMARRKTPNAWITSWLGIHVPPSRWDDGSWITENYKGVRKHEYVGHYLRIKNRPYLSRVWWCIHYNLSKKMQFDEEIFAFRVEASVYPAGQQRERFIEWATLALMTDYGFAKMDQDDIAKQIGFGL